MISVPALPLRRELVAAVKLKAPEIVTGLLFLVLFFDPFRFLIRDWWSDPEAGHGLLLGPLAIILAWRKGIGAKGKGEESIEPSRYPAIQHGLGAVVLGSAVLLRYLSGLAAELYTMRMSMLIAAAGLVVFYAGWRQLVRWWLPAALLVLSVPLPAVVLGTLALPLQLKASAIGTALLEWRHVPVLLSGNVIHLPGRSLFVTEACSGLRSLTALLALGVLVGGLWLKLPISRALLVALAIPVAMLLNGVRVFLTGFLVYFVNPGLGDGFMHFTEGWVIFVVAFGILGLVAWGLTRLERRMAGSTA